MTCPVVKTIKEIYGAGWHDGDDTESLESVIKIGGNDSTEYVCGETVFYMTMRKMDLARFELKLNTFDLNFIKKKFLREYKYLMGVTYAEIYQKIIDDVLTKHLYNQFVNLIDLIAQMEEMVATMVEVLGRKGKAINISLPDIILLPNIDKLILYNPDILHYTVNKIVDYANKINIKSLISIKTIPIPHIDKFDTPAPDMKTRTPEFIPQQPSDYYDAMKVLSKHEIIVAEYVYDIEKYHCKVINHMNFIYDLCKKIIDAITHNHLTT